MQGVDISFPLFGEGFVIDPPTYFMMFGRPVYWYAVIIAAGFLLAMAYILKTRRAFGLTQDNALDMFILAVVAGIVGARLYYVIFNPDPYFGPGKWLNIFKLWEGGLAVYGGIIAAAAAFFIYGRVKKMPPGVLFDMGSLGLLIGQAVGRWGNLINREAYGAPTDLPWKMGLTAGGETLYVHPTFLYESLWNLLGFLLLHTVVVRRRRYDGQIFLLYLAWYGFGRFFVEGLRQDSLYLAHTGIRVSQLMAAATLCAAVVLLLINRLRRRHKPEALYVNRVAAQAARDDAAAEDTQDTGAAGQDDPGRDAENTQRGDIPEHDAGNTQDIPEHDDMPN